MNRISLLAIWTSILFIHSPAVVTAQCFANVTHVSGTETVGCVDVTVTSSGAASGGGYCGVGPYFIGAYNEGSFTFVFSQPLSSVYFDITAINNSPPNGTYEEIFVYVNGSPYILDNAGIQGACLVQTVLTASGTLASPPNNAAMSNNVLVNGPISTLTIECQHNGSIGFGSGVIFSLYICCCQTDAGVISASPLILCPSEAATVPPATQTVLDGDDILQYILFSNPADTLGSILATSNTPSFAFNPATMQTGVTYYIAAIAGNNLNGNVDLNDPCLHISNAIPVTWQSLPTVTFSAANPEVCAGACTTVTANFMGTAPFTLTYTTPAGTAMQTFSGNTGTFQVCTAAGAPPGSFSVEATALMDAFCTCN